MKRNSPSVMADPSFSCDEEGLREAITLLGRWRAVEPPATKFEFPAQLPEYGIGHGEALQRLAPWVIGHAARLDAPDALAHMDPPTPWVTWAACLWNAALNQNLMHAMTSPAAQDVERRVLAWLCPWFGMTGGQLLPGSTLANLTALWAARERKNIRRVVASGYAHVSVRKAAHLLGLEFVEAEADEDHMLRAHKLTDLRDCALVLTAGTTASGAIDPLDAGTQAAWRHVDAAWAGPLALSEQYRSRLQGIENADYVAVSAHKWLFQPKESAFVLFRAWDQVSPALSFGSGYLALPSVGLLGSHGTTAVPLLATLMAWGREGLVQRVERCMEIADELVSCPVR